jgi:hypothetical protein
MFYKNRLRVETQDAPIVNEAKSIDVQIAINDQIEEKNQPIGTVQPNTQAK